MTNTACDSVDTRRARLHSDISRAARVIPTHHPLATFIAVNPLAGLEHMPFEQAVRRAGDLYGVAGTLPESEYRSLHRQGRIAAADIDGALCRRYPHLRRDPDLSLGGRRVSALELLRADLLHGLPGAEPRRCYRTRAERIAPDVADLVDTQAAKWSAAYFGAARWSMPGRADGFYAAWRHLAPHDHTLPRPVRAALRTTAARADDAVLAALDALEVRDDARVTYLQAHLTRLPGWAAHVQWCAGRDAGIDLMQYLAMRLTYEATLLTISPKTVVAECDTHRPPTARERAVHLLGGWGLEGVTDAEVTAAARVLAALPVAARPMIWQHAFEAGHRDALLDALAGEPVAAQGLAHTAVVTCIDTRSEGLRRHLETVGGYETYGFAGFFAAAIRYTDLLGGAPADLCPVLISPAHEVAEQPAPHAVHRAARRITGMARLAAAEGAFDAAKHGMAAPFTLADAAGWAAAPLSAAKTLMPAATGALRRRLRDVASPAAPTVVGVDEMSLGDRTFVAQAALTTMGLTRGFGRLLVLCAHGSSTENNPYQSALDCGACGGQAGGPNARTLARILNQPDVRDRLRECGIDIPAGTYAVATLHDTATDRVSVLDTHLVPPSHRTHVRQLCADLAAAGAALAAERCPALPGGTRRSTAVAATRHAGTRSLDWAQVYPEWGLAGNAVFVIGPRRLTRGRDLSRRAFLHSYDAEGDEDGTALETIMTAPLVVAQWINCQYYFSAVAPQVFGAGTKTIHNVVGTAGVLAGHSGDLRLGLPWQSVSDGHRLVHEPQRLLAVIEAPLSRIDSVVARNPVLQQLFANDWVAVAAREGADRPWRRWTRSGWREWHESVGHTNEFDDKEMVP